jgi:hypothetical protein
MRHTIAMVCVIGTATLLGLAGSASGQPGKADGQFTLGGKPVKLAYAYASAGPGFFDKKKDDIQVILTDVPLTGAALTDDFARIDLAKAGKLHCLEVTIDAAKAPISVTLRHQALKMPQSGGSSYEVFEAKTFDGKTISGRFYRKQPGMTFDDIPYTYDVTFEAVVTKKAGR